MYDMTGGEAALGLGALLIPMLVSLAVCLFMVIVQWKVFAKAGEPGWACLVPIYNVWTMFKIAQGNGVRCYLTLIPVAGFFFSIGAILDLARSFGKSTGFGWGMLLFAPIFWTMLAFGGATYVGPQQK